MKKITSLLHINPFLLFLTHMKFPKYRAIYCSSPGRSKLVWDCHSVSSPTPLNGWHTTTGLLTSWFTGVVFFLETWGFLLKCKEDNDCSIKKSTWSLLPAYGGSLSFEFLLYQLINLRHLGRSGALNFWQKSRTKRANALFYCFLMAKIVCCQTQLRIQTGRRGGGSFTVRR